jgi:hypothetical protein
LCLQVTRCDCGSSCRRRPCPDTPQLFLCHHCCGGLLLLLLLLAAALHPFLGSLR